MLDRYEPSAFEESWRNRWDEDQVFRTDEDPAKPKFYILEFFPYPSGAGLSVGHCRNYIPSDVIARYKKMRGFRVLHPMGWDAFGLPAENEAIAKKTHPGPMVESYAANYRRQMRLVGLSYDWNREVNSSHPNYYRWTQWIFAKLFEQGLAYQAMASVNWDPVEKTVLADEEVIGGLGWRSGAPVEKKQIPQWFMKITAYADRLLEDLDGLDWPEGIKQQQRNWIGKSVGVELDFEVQTPAPEESSEENLQQVVRPKPLRVFTTRIDTLFGATFCVIAPEHELVSKLPYLVEEEDAERIREYVERAKSMSDTDRTSTTREKTGVFAGLHAINPATQLPVPIWVADYVLGSYGTGAIMAVPGHDARDFEFAQKHDLPIMRVIAASEAEPGELPYESSEGVLVNSGAFTGLTVQEAQQRMADWAEQTEIGTRKTQYKLRDWLISRQRYWGCPIPIIHSADGTMEAVPSDTLPVLLPDVENYEPSGDGTSPLAGIPDFVNVADSEGRLARRETDTMAGFACSSWYFLRFCDPEFDELPETDEAKQRWKQKLDQWMPVDCYVGGAEHAVMHLLYARFWTKFLYDLGCVSVKEPFAQLLNQGQVLARTPFRAPKEGEKLSVGEDAIQITFDEARAMPETDVQWRWARMSKSKGNVVTPDEVVEKWGADSLRVYELFVAPFEADVQWSDEGLQGAQRFLSRVYRLAATLQPHFQTDWRERISTVSDPEAVQLRKSTHRAIHRATEELDRFSFNNYVAILMTFLNEFQDSVKALETGSLPELEMAASEAIETMILLLSPGAPFLTDELWRSFGRSGFTAHQSWPVTDPALLVKDSVTIAVQVNGKLRGTFDVEPGTTKEELEKLAPEVPKVVPFLEGKQIVKVIVVPDKLVNLVVR
jgi:leucyl-tRNA synthetase